MNTVSYILHCLTKYAITDEQILTISYAGLFLVSFLLFRVFFTPRQYLNNVPMPGGASWLWGHEKTVFDMSVGRAYAMWLNTLGSHVIKIKGALFKPDIIVLADPLAITHIMQRRIYDYPHSEVVRPRIARLLGKSLGWVEGESEHKRMRQLVAPALSNENIRKGASEIFVATETMQSTLGKYVLDYNGSVEVNIMHWMHKVNLDIIGRYGFGHNFEGGGSDDARNILESWRNMASLGISQKGFLALMLLRRFPILNRLPLKALDAQGNVKRTIQRGVAQELIRRNNGIGATYDHDLLSRLLLAHNDGKISTDELMDHISMFIMAGSETTSQALSYAIWESAKNPEKQALLREEITLFSSNPSFDDVQAKMPYLDGVMRETLRLHPPAPYMERISEKEDSIPLRYPVFDKTGKPVYEVAIKVGQTVIIPIHAINRHDSAWGDSNVFRPDRWMEPLPSQDLLTTGWSNMLTFSDGPRNCIGYKLAIFEFKVILQALVRSFEFHDTGAKIKDRVASSMTPVVIGREKEGPMLPIKITII